MMSWHGAVRTYIPSNGGGALDASLDDERDRIDAASSSPPSPASAVRATLCGSAWFAATVSGLCGLCPRSAS
jgi:hypothetical protein